MGFGGFVNFALKCFDVLAWPLFALGYPLCASIHAIETNSNWQTRKLVTYWVLFSLISLFEHAFVKLLEWVPFWSYIKLVIILWLAIPRFDGAFCIYKHLVRPCLSLDMQILINWLYKWKDFVLKRDELLTEAERYDKENESYMEKLIASKPSLQSKSEKPCLVIEESRAAAEEGEGSKCQGPSVMQKDIKTVEETKKKEVTATKQVNQPEPNLAHIENMTFAPVEVKETTAAVEAGWEPPQMPAFEKVQKEWTCAICQVTTQNETTLKFHLQGRRHQAACEVLKAKNQASKSKAQPASSSKTSDLPKQEKCASSHKTTSQEAKRSDPPKEVLEKVLKEWTCTICQVTTQSKATLSSHLQGRQHQAACEELKAKNQASKSNAQPASASKKSDLPKQEKCVSSHKITSEEVKRSNAPKEVPEKCASNNELKHSVISRHEEKVQGQQGLKKKCVEFKQSKWWCKICNISCTSEDNMDCHLKGRRHLLWARSVEFKESKWWCTICNISCTSEGDMDGHLYGKKHSLWASSVEFKQSKWWCTVCHISCTSEGDMDCHLYGNKHLSASGCV